MLQSSMFHTSTGELNKNLMIWADVVIVNTSNVVGYITHQVIDFANIN